MREVYQAERGKAPEIVAAFKILDQWFEKAGYTNRRIYVDYTGPMDTVVYQWELESLDEYFTMERGTFIEPDKDTQALIDAMNTNARSGLQGDLRGYRVANRSRSTAGVAPCGRRCVRTWQDPGVGTIRGVPGPHG